MARKLAHVLIWGLPLILVVEACSSVESTRAKSGHSASASVEAPADERADRPRRRGGRREPPSDAVSRLIQEALRSDGSISYSTLIQKLGTPRRVETETVPNQYVQGQIDTLRTLVYGGIRATMYDVANDSKSFLVRLSLSAAQHTTPEGLRVGLTEERAIDVLGLPTRRNAPKGALIYQETESTPTSMVLQIRNGRVIRIDWEFHFT